MEAGHPLFTLVLEVEQTTIGCVRFARMATDANSVACQKTLNALLSPTIMNTVPLTYGEFEAYMLRT